MRRRFRVTHWISAIALAFLWTQAALASPVDVHVLAGGTVAMGSEASATLTPSATVLVSLPLAAQQQPGDGWLPIPPQLHVGLDLTGLQGETIDPANAETWRALEFRLGLSQRLFATLNADLYAEAGFATRLPGELEARDTTARWVGAGVRVGRLGPGWLTVALGADQRLDGRWQPAVLLAGAVELYGGERALGAHLFLVGDASLGLAHYGNAPRRDVVRVGLAVGR